ncbi:MICOS complex subunit mic25-a-like [Watersipora subatra]|uniref:MICOS complex subunit mic25-a-like n=1 Tax=Watersipora subatra TaxID=2589382 RepID=UPI00355B38ED
MGGSQSAESSTVSMDNPNSIQVTENVLCYAEGPKPVIRQKNMISMKREYKADQKEHLTAKLDEDYVAWLKDVEAANEDITKRVRDELVQKADDLHERFSYIEKKPVCERAKMDLLKCYEQNRTNSLDCVQEVKYFTTCVRNHQLNFNKKDYTPKQLPRRPTTLL